MKKNLNFLTANYLSQNNKSDIYKPKNKTEVYILKGATYTSKFVLLINDSSEGSAYINKLFNDGKRLLVDKGFNFVNTATSSSIQSIHLLFKNKLIFLTE